MKEYIERGWLLELYTMGGDESAVQNYHVPVPMILETINAAPAADVLEVRHAKWVSLTPPLLLEEFREMEADIFFMCSECKDECKLVEQDDYYDYCPRCGCKMDKEE